MSRTASITRSSRALPSPPSYSPHPPSPSSSSTSSPAFPSPQIPPSLSHSRTYSQPSASHASRPHTTFVPSPPASYVPGGAPTPERTHSAYFPPSTSETVLTTSPAVGGAAGAVGGDVVMTWAGGSTTSVSTQPDAPPNAVSDSRILSAQVAELNRYARSGSEDDAGGDDTGSVVRIEDDPNALPPSYDDARTISAPTVFTFSSHSFNSMLLIPPADAADTRPVLYVSVAMNCFNPGSYVTTVRRGGTEMGEWLGEFEMGISAISGTVTYGNTTRKIGAVLQKKGSKRESTGTWTYAFSSQSPNLTWEWNGNVMKCYVIQKGTFKPSQIAVFTGTSIFQAHVNGRRAPPPTLKLWPEGYERKTIGHVVLSALIIERKRTCPATSDTKHLFS